MKIGWIGVHAEGVAALEAVCATEYNVVGFMTLKKEKAEHRCGSVSYESVCDRHKIPLFEVAHVNDESSLQILRLWDCDVLVVLGWGQILSREALSTAKIGVVGAHASLLPHNRGSAPVNWAIINGEQQTGNSLIWLKEGVDSGNIIDQRSFPITAYDTCATVYDRVAESNREMMLGLLSQLEQGKKPGRAQAETGAAVLPRRRPQDGVIDWNTGSEEIYNLIRALARPYPGAFAYLDGASFRVWQAALLPCHEPMAPAGTILGAVRSPEEYACGVLVATADGIILLLELEDAAGRVYVGRELSEQNWAGHRLSNAA